jgi:uncharacterized membrane protein (UPF0127 family)
MAKLYKTSSAGAELLLDRLDLAEGLWSRGKGLLGRKKLESHEALWIRPCNNIHTFFMKFAIDCIFVDKKMEIKNLAKNVGPFRFVGPFWRSHSVIETKSGFIDAKKLEVGDHLYVVN